MKAREWGCIYIYIYNLDFETECMAFVALKVNEAEMNLMGGLTKFSPSICANFHMNNFLYSKSELLTMFKVSPL